LTNIKALPVPATVTNTDHTGRLINVNDALVGPSTGFQNAQSSIDQIPLNPEIPVVINLPRPELFELPPDSPLDWQRIHDIRTSLELNVADHLDYEVYLFINKFYEKRFRRQMGETNLNPLNIMLTGGPGTGKTYAINLASKLDPDNPMVYIAPTGAAASLLRKGTTVHNQFQFSIGGTIKNATQLNVMPPLPNGSIKNMDLIEKF